MKLYEKMRCDENLSWCKPLSFLDGRVIIAINEGEIIDVQIDGHDQPINTDSIRELAHLVNDYYDSYRGYSDTHIILDSDGRELGCSDCPWRDMCEAMIITDEEE